MGKIVILMGSDRDLEHCQQITKHLRLLNVEYVLRVGSAHKTPQKVIEILKEFECEKVVYITVAGRSNALSAFVDSNSSKPVIACPPYSDKYGGADVYSSLRVPSGVGTLVTIEPDGAAIAAAKMFAIEDKELEKRICAYQSDKKSAIEEADKKIKEMK